MDFRKDINALRALAVSAVLLFHFEVPGVQGGFAGVDIFFVISGYLMTSIISRRLERNSFSVWNFYLDRAHRILPALCVMCLALLLAGWFLLFPPDYMALGKYALSAVVFLSNIAFFRDTGYFDTAPTEKWLLHTWSLSVEWQFYLLYPLLLLTLRKFVGHTATVYWLAGIGLASFLSSVMLSASYPSAAFYLLPTRAWEMIAGGIVFLFPVAYTARSRMLAERGGLALIIGACVMFDHGDVWPGWLAVVPVIGTALVISASNLGSPLYGNVIIQFIGQSSYSIYLWHWPIVVGLHYLGKNREGAWIVAAILLSVVLGWLSMRYVENIMRAGASDRMTASAIPDPRIGGAVLPIVSAGSAIAVFSASVFILEGVPQAVRAINAGERSKFIESYETMHKTGLSEAYRAECDFYDWNRKTAKERISSSCTPASTEIFIWGDSHAQALSQGIRDLMPSQIQVAQVATSGCTPSLGPERERSSVQNNCNKSNLFALAEISRLRPRTVLIAQRRDHEKTDWLVMAKRLHEAGVKNVIVLGPLPNWLPSLPSVVARAHWLDPSPYVSSGLDKTKFATDRIMRRRWERVPELEYVSIMASMCRANACLGIVPDSKRVLMAVDYGHLTVSGSRHIARTVLAEPLSAWHRLAP